MQCTCELFESALVRMRSNRRGGENVMMLVGALQFSNWQVMRKQTILLPSMIAIRRIGFVLLLCFTASLLWCGDTNCIAETSHDDCPSLICSLNSNGTHSSQNHPSGNTKECSCVCHVPSIVSSSINVLRFLTTQRNQADIVLHIPSPFGRPVYRPPIAA